MAGGKPRRLYDPATAPRWTPKKDWVELGDGSSICVWELSVAEEFQVAEAAQRHPQDPRPGPNEGEAATWLLAYACRRDDEPASPRIWPDPEVHRIPQLAPDDFARLLIAARGLLEAAPESEARSRDFTPAPAARKPKSPTGASSSSTGCPAS